MTRHISLQNLYRFCHLLWEKDSTLSTTVYSHSIWLTHKDSNDKAVK